MEAQDSKIRIIISYEGQTTEIDELKLSNSMNGLELVKQQCRIMVPWANITTVAKNKLCLILWLSDPSRQPPEQSWEEEPEQSQELDQGKKMDSLLFSMLLNITKGKAFQNTLKGNFELQLVFPSLNFLSQTQQSIQKGIRDIQQNLQSKGTMMEPEVGVEQDIQHDI